MTLSDAGLSARLATGTEVEVLTRFERHWTTGFEIVAFAGDGFILRRRSDGAVLPASFSADEVRPRG